MTMQESVTFEEFWETYVRAHADPRNRALHFAGTTAALGCLALGLATRRRWLLVAAPIVGYGLAFTGHFLFEKNEPLTFRHPIHSLRADFKMWAMMLMGKMADEVERVAGEPNEAEKAQRSPASSEAAVNGSRSAGAPLH